ncbi:plasmid mobilization relaxosome protein MobC [Anaerotruncus sp. 1XD42-93]|uniref:plasmid mobilization protein n=1 Tax=Anaerotruncus sp. 1XD42-93 TaxID=2320853 RepID=UPI001412E6A6|nr:plasmid mobilization relaxosome protein MobC [Anaerotruncus sp. 1XD42-93]NBK20210.1 plasmid mobilization relaxosome protein MobC [Anaerotruncus sp. 1XD42-93]
MSAAKRKREVQVNFRVSPEELALIEQKMSQLGTVNREAYLRKMALDGYVVKLDLPELKELVSLMRYSSNNLNQLTRKVHEIGRVYDADLEDISQRQEQLWDGVQKILAQLAKLS